MVGTASSFMCGKWSVRLNHLDPALTARKKPLLSFSNGRQVICMGPWRETPSRGRHAAKRTRRSQACRCGPRSPGGQIQSGGPFGRFAQRVMLACCEGASDCRLLTPELWLEPTTPPPARCGTAKPAYPRSRDTSQVSYHSNVNVRATSTSRPARQWKKTASDEGHSVGGTR